MLGLIAEQLRTPALSAEEFTKAQQKRLAVASSAVWRAPTSVPRTPLVAPYPQGHPNRPVAPEDMLAKSHRIRQARRREGLPRDPLRSKPHEDGGGRRGCCCPCKPRWVVFFRRLEGWHDSSPRRAVGARRVPPHKMWPCRARPVFSVVLGQPSGLRYSDSDYQALRLATAILGSGFAGRLMANVRDRKA